MNRPLHPITDVVLQYRQLSPVEQRGALAEIIRQATPAQLCEGVISVYSREQLDELIEELVG